MSLRLKNGRWEIDFYPHGRSAGRIQKRLPPGTPEDVAQALYADLVSRYKDAPIDPIDLGLTVSQLGNKYLAWYEMYRAPSTLKDVRHAFEFPIDKVLGKIVAEDISPGHILDYQRSRRADGVSNRTINKELAYLSGCLRWAAKQENAFITPRTWKVEPLPYARPIPQILSADEVQRILEAAEPFYRAMFLCLYSLGLRMNEARQLKWSDIDRENMSLTVRQKGGTFKRLPISATLLGALEEIVTPPGCRQGKAHKRQAVAVAGRGGYVFVNEQTGKPILQIRKAIARSCKKAGIDKHVYPHLFRHSVATHLMGDNVNLRTIQKYLGHSTVKTTEFYTHVGQAHLQGAADLIEAGLHRKKRASEK